MLRGVFDVGQVGGVVWFVLSVARNDWPNEVSICAKTPSLTSGMRCQRINTDFGLFRLEGLYWTRVTSGEMSLIATISPQSIWWVRAHRITKP